MTDQQIKEGLKLHDSELRKERHLPDDEEVNRRLQAQTDRLNDDQAAAQRAREMAEQVIAGQILNIMASRMAISEESLVSQVSTANHTPAGIKTFLDFGTRVIDPHDPEFGSRHVQTAKIPTSVVYTVIGKLIYQKVIRRRKSGWAYFLVDTQATHKEYREVVDRFYEENTKRWENYRTLKSSGDILKRISYDQVERDEYTQPDDPTFGNQYLKSLEANYLDAQLPLKDDGLRYASMANAERVKAKRLGIKAAARIHRTRNSVEAKLNAKYARRRWFDTPEGRTYSRIKELAQELAILNEEIEQLETALDHDDLGCDMEDDLSGVLEPRRIYTDDELDNGLGAQADNMTDDEIRNFLDQMFLRSDHKLEKRFEAYLLSREERDKEEERYFDKMTDDAGDHFASLGI